MSRKENQDDSCQQERLCFKIIQDRLGEKLDELEKKNKSQNSLLCAFKTEINNLLEEGTKITELTQENETIIKMGLNFENSGVILRKYKNPLINKEETGSKNIKINDKEEKKGPGIHERVHRPKISNDKVYEGKKEISTQRNTKNPIVQNIKGSKKISESVSKKSGNILKNNMKMNKRPQHIQNELVVENKENRMISLLYETVRNLEMEECTKILKDLDNHRISIIISVDNPPKSIIKMMEAICIILDEHPSWENARKIAEQNNFLLRLSEIKLKFITKEKYYKVEHILDQEVMKQEDIVKISKTAEIICDWLHSYLKFAEIVDINESNSPDNLDSTKNNDQYEEEKINNQRYSNTIEQEKALKQIALEEECYDILKRIEGRFMMEMQALPRPPIKLQRLFEVVCLILGERPTWMEARRAIVDIKQFFGRLFKAKGRSMPYKIYKKVKYLLIEEDLSPEYVVRFSVGAKILSEWAHSIIRQRELLKGSEATSEEMEEETRKQAEEDEKEEIQERKDLKKLEEREADLLERHKKEQ